MSYQIIKISINELSNNKISINELSNNKNN
jgi:hypothetical protein